MNREELENIIEINMVDASDHPEYLVKNVCDIMSAIDSYVSAEIERVTLVTPEMLDKIEVYWLHNMDYAGELTKQLRERAKGE